MVDCPRWPVLYLTASSALLGAEIPGCADFFLLGHIQTWPVCPMSFLVTEFPMQVNMQS